MVRRYLMNQAKKTSLGDCSSADVFLMAPQEHTHVVEASSAELGAIDTENVTTADGSESLQPRPSKDPNDPLVSFHAETGLV